MEKINLFHWQFIVSNINEFSHLLCKQIYNARSEKNLRCTLLPVTMNEVVLASNNTSFKKKISNFTYLTMDGMPLVFLARMKGFSKAQRIYGPELMEMMCKIGRKKHLKHFFYGSTQHVIDALESSLVQRFPGINVVGSYAPPFRSLTKKEEQKIIAKIKRSKTDIVWIGLGGEKQVKWIDSWKDKLPNISLMAVGAAFDFLSKNKKQAPPWIRNHGFEWLFRFFCEPRRLWKRYIMNFPVIIGLIFKEGLTGFETYE
jgi:N-acetylglucosaminyldiphosphoundecaprenol N-acetyl-beta-D-mannosaminyltransferase